MNLMSIITNTTTLSPVIPAKAGIYCEASSSAYTNNTRRNGFLTKSGRTIVIALFFLLSFFVVLPTSAHAANLYWVGTDGAATNVASNWKTTDPASCGSGDAGAAPTTTDVIIFDPDCDNGAAVTTSFSVLGVSMVSGYTGTVTQNAVSMTIGSSGWTQAGGTFTGNSDGSTANITIQTGGDFNLTGGTFTSTNDTLTETDDWTVNGGTFTHNSGIVSFTAAADNASTITGSTNLYALTFISPGGVNEVFTVASGTTLLVSNTLTLTGGNDGANKIHGPGTISAQGDITTTGAGYTGNITININGTGSQTLTGEDDSNTQLPSITINKASGTLTFSSVVVLSQNFTYTTGTLDFGTTTVMFINNNTVSSTSTITGNVTFYNLTFDSPGSVNEIYAISDGTTLTVSNTLTLIGQSDSANRINGPGSISAQGDITITGTGFTGTATVVINGSGSQTITGEGDTNTQLPAININKAAGTLNLSSTIVSSYGWTYTQGTVSPGSSTVIFKLNNSYYSSETITGSLTFNNVTFGNQAGANETYTIASGTNLTVTGTLTFPFTDGADTVNGPGTIITQGDVTTSGNGVVGDVPLTLSGSSNQTITASGTNFPDGTITINKSSGTVTLAASLNLNGSGQDLTITSGKLDMATYNLTVADALTVNGSLKQSTGNLVMTAGSMTVGSTGSFINNSTGDVSIASGQSITNNGYIRLDGTEPGCNDVAANNAISLAAASGTASITNNGRLRVYDTTITNVTIGAATTIYSSALSGTTTNFTNNDTCPAEKTWDGGAATTAWATTGNWSKDGGTEAAPGTTTLVIFDDTSDQSATTPTSATTLLGIEIRYGYGGTVTQGSGTNATLTLNASGFLQQDGTFTGNSDGNTSNITLGSAGDFTLSGGTFTSTNDTLTIIDNMTINGGIFTANSGTLQISGTNGVTSAISGIITLYKLTFPNMGFSQPTLSLASGTILTVTNTLTMSNQYLDNRSLLGPGYISAQGDISLNPSSANGGGWEGDAVIEISGTGTQNITGTGIVPSLTINKPSGTLNISGNISITENLTYTQGTVDSTGGTVQIFPYYDLTATISGSLTFNDLTFRDIGAGGTPIVTIQSGTVLTVNGTLTMDQQYGGRQINGGSITANGNITTVQTGWGGNVPITLSGSANQTVTLANASEFPTGTLTINKPSGTVTLGSNITLDAAGQDLLISKGTLDLSTFQLTVADNITVSGGGVLKSYTGGDLVVGSGGVTNAGQINLGNPQTCGGADSSTITSSSGGAARTWSGNGLANLYDVSVTDQTESPVKGNGVVWSGTNGGNNNFKFNANCPTPPNAHWKFDEGTGTSANDSGAFTNTGTLAGATVPAWKTEDQCVAGKCLYFDGSTSNVTVANVIKQVSSVSVWVKPTSVADIALLDLDGGTHRITVSTGTISATGFSSPTIYINGIATTTLTANIWQLVTVTTGTAFDTTSSLTLGKYSGGSKFFPGFIDEPKIYNYVLSSSQIKSDFASKGTNDLTSVVLGANTQNMPDALSDGLVGYWKTDEAAGATNAVDSSGNGNTGTYTGNATTAAGKFGNAESSDGTGDFITVPHSSSLNITTGSWTVSGWFYDTESNYNHGGRVIIKKQYDDGSAASPFSIGIEYNNITLKGEAGYTESGISYNLTSNGYTTNTWTHYAGTYNSATQQMSLYLDGKLVVGPTTVTPPAGNTDVVAIGGNGAGQGSWLGKLDETRVYNRTLSPNEVSQLYSFAPGPVGYWNMDEKTGTTAADSSGSGYNGTLTNMASPATSTSGWSNGKYGGGLNFDHSNDFVNIGTTATSLQIVTPGLTESGWIKYTGDGSLPGGSRATLFASYSNAGVQGYSVELTGSTTSDIAARVVTHTGAADTCASANGTIVVNKWHYVTGSYDGTNLRIYIDGVLRNTCAASGDITASALHYKIGSRATASSASSDNLFQGTLDEVKIYNYARTSAQIIEDMNAGHPAPGSPVSSAVAHWKLDEGYGTTANDSTPNDNDLTLSTATASWTTSGKFNKSWQGVGTNWVSRADDADLDFSETDDGTISLWFRSNSATNPAAQEYLLSKGPGSTAAGYSVYATTGGLLCFGVDDDTTFGPDDSACTTADIYDLTWHHITAIKTAASRIDLYVDGKATASDTSIAATATLANSSTLYIGDFNGTDNANEFNGRIDEVKVYRSALTASQVGLDYNQSSAQTVGTLSSSQTEPKSGSSLYCIPGDATTCTAPIGEWSLDEGSGTTVNDKAGNAYTGTLTNGPTWATGKFNKGVRFDGTDDYLNVGSGFTPLNGLSAVTLETWVNFSNSSEKYVVSIDGQADIRVNPNNIAFSLATSGGFTVYRPTVTIDANKWHHIVGVYNGSTMAVYLDGKLVNSQAKTGTISSLAANGLVLGAANSAGGYMTGIIDQTQIFTYARSAAQIAWDYNKGKPIAHWAMDECQGTVINDSSGNALTGTLTIGATGTNTIPGTCQTSGAWFDGATGKRNYSMDFDGSNDYISMVAAPNVTSDYGTMSAWVKTSTSYANSGMIMYGCDTGSCSDGFGGEREIHIHFSNTSNTVGFYINGNTGTTTLASPNAYNDGNWHLITATWVRGGALALYVDGLPVASGTSTSALQYSLGSTFRIGTNSVPNRYFSGQIDDAKVFNYPLTAAQIKTLYNDGAYRTGPSTGAP